MDVHFVAVPAHRLVAVYIPVSVYEVLHVALISLALRYDILMIKRSCPCEQRVDFFRYILFRSEMALMQSLLKKRDIFLFCLFISNYLFWVYTSTIKIFAFIKNPDYSGNPKIIRDKVNNHSPI